ncbi:MAG: hypothetical protein JZU65_12365 [Chlorobium sp.]|nr:hypothetical protein [Chlorobium sp.]
MPKCHATDCTHLTLEPTIFYYIVNLSVDPPNIKNIFVLHRGCDVSKKFETTLSSAISTAENSGVIFGHAKATIDPATMLNFLQRYYGEPKTWAAFRASQNISLASSAKPVGIKSGPVPNAQTLTASLNVLAGLSVFNPALFPNSNRGFIDVSIGTHPPIVTYCYVSFKVYTVPESAAKGMLWYGQDFVKVLAQLAELTRKKSWIKNNGGKDWSIRSISDFLFTECSQVDNARLMRLLGLLSQPRSRVNILGVRVSRAASNKKQLETFVRLVI